ncbi:hypothetical protein MUK42_28469 [Musa troglodytarum]|uniref:Uncharacterized protein n=1 Tax=Musa troglodytarum TaxID=320322 RepID=A0A9E7JKZ7_9LILI|nr:hypothetical protein MUK42_28469 [Musa troglodytarum]
MLSLSPRTLPLRAVHRHTAASRSTTPCSSEQQGCLGGVPSVTLSKPRRTLAQMPSFSASLGHLAPVSDGRFCSCGTVSWWRGSGRGRCSGGLPLLAAVARWEKRRLRVRRRASDTESLEAMASRGGSRAWKVLLTHGTAAVLFIREGASEEGHD